jgi:predicted DCC family thiol-disulfide oxidoreductase YuxK
MPWKAISILSGLPLFITDGGYKFIAKHRYRLFGKKESVVNPSAELSHRFIF